jgi:nucleotide-binding universal stress UspA family protein
MKCARALADRFDAALIGVGAEMVPPLAAGPVAGPITADWYVAMNASIEAGLVEAQAAFDAAARGCRAAPVWETVVWFPGQALATASRSADLVVASRSPGGHENTYRDATPGELVIASGRPVLIAPRSGPPLAAERIVFAWKDTREARRAMSDALPFFKQAKAVLVLQVVSEDEIDAQAGATDVVAALKRHGVAAEAKVESCVHPGATAILEQAKAFGADLIVAGGYGHTRLGEWVFGGVTRELLAKDDVYVLLSH